MGFDVALGEVVATFEGVVDQAFDGLHGERLVVRIETPRLHPCASMRRI
jgi:hypothetical protein